MEPWRTPLDGMGAQARQAGGVQSPAARRARHELRGQHGDLSLLPTVRYVITLDSDTQLPIEAARAWSGRCRIR